MFLMLKCECSWCSIGGRNSFTISMTLSWVPLSSSGCSSLGLLIPSIFSCSNFVSLTISILVTNPRGLFCHKVAVSLVTYVYTRLPTNTCYNQDKNWRTDKEAFPNLKSLNFHISSKTFMVITLAVQSRKHFELIFVYGMRWDSQLIFYMWLSSCCRPLDKGGTVYFGLRF